MHGEQIVQVLDWYPLGDESVPLSDQLVLAEAIRTASRDYARVVSEVGHMSAVNVELYQRIELLERVLSEAVGVLRQVVHVGPFIEVTAFGPIALGPIPS